MRRTRLFALLALLALALAFQAGALVAQEAVPTGPPQRLVLPALDIDVVVEALDLHDDLTMPALSRAATAAWYTYGATAGAAGNAVPAGHRDWQGQAGVFGRLGRLAEGDAVWLQDSEGVFYLSTVAWSMSVPDDDAPLPDILGATKRPSPTLITCSGTFNRQARRYPERRIVRASLATVITPD